VFETATKKSYLLYQADQFHMTRRLNLIPEKAAENITLIGKF